MGSLDVCCTCIFDTWVWPNCSPGTSKLPTDAQNSANMLNVLSANPLDSVKPPTNCRCGLQIVVYSPFGSGSNINYSSAWHAIPVYPHLARSGSHVRHRVGSWHRVRHHPPIVLE